MTVASLLPRNATALERAVEQVSAPSDSADVIRPAYRPAEIPAATLPWLAWAFDVPLWPADLAERRGIVADSWNLHRLRGTLGGLRAVARYTGAEITKATTPPAKCFASPALSRSERNAFVQRYPQLRIYRYRTQGQRVGIHAGECLGLNFPVQSDALNRFLPRAYLSRDGVETELSISESAASFTEVRVPGTAGRLSFVCGFPRHLTVTEASQRVYRVALQQTYRDANETLRRVAIEPGLETISVRPDVIAQTGQGIGVFAGQYVARCLVPSSAGDRLYQRLYLFDRNVEVIRRSATLHLNAGRLGMPAHHAELSVRIASALPRQAVGRYVRGYLVATDQSALGETLAAMRNMARASDRISINTVIKRPVTAGESVLAGSLIAGDWIN